MAAPQLSIVIPMLNEESNIELLFKRLFASLDALDVTFEVVAIDDGSTDTTLELLRKQQEARSELRILTFARNFGQHAAVLAGFEAAQGTWIVTLDADLQNPPEEIGKLVEAFREGHDLVNTIRAGRDDPLFRRVASKLVNSVARKWSGIQLNDFGCMLRGYHRDLIGPMTQRREFGTFLPALAMLYAKSPTEIHVAHAARAQGESKYSLLKLFRLQLDLVTSFSLAPLRLLFGLGSVIAAAGILFGVLLLALRLWFGAEWAGQGVFTLFAVLFFFVGAQFLAFGLLGEYVGRIYQEVRERPVYLLRDELTAAIEASPPESSEEPKTAEGSDADAVEVEEAVRS